MIKDMEEIQRMIDGTDYWDARILELKSDFFGDKIIIVIEDDVHYVWEIVFSSCLSVSYETDASWRKIHRVENMSRPQLGYYGQKIEVYDQSDEGFYTIQMDLSIMNMNIICRYIDVNHKKNETSICD